MFKRSECKGTTNRPAVMLHDGAAYKARKPNQFTSGKKLNCSL